MGLNVKNVRLPEKLIQSITGACLNHIHTRNNYTCQHWICWHYKHDVNHNSKCYGYITN